jgi:hypothetical protein
MSRILQALSTDFRRFLRDRDFRKPDVMGISADGGIVEFLEVTTVGRKDSAAKQLRDKLDTVRNTVEKIMQASLPIDWRAADWRPPVDQLAMPLPSKPREVRWLCFVPTYQEDPPRGVILYGVHCAEFLNGPPVAVPRPDSETLNHLREALSNRQKVAGSDEEWARREIAARPALHQFLRVLASILGVVAAIAFVIDLLDPEPFAKAGLAMLIRTLFTYALAA